MGLYGEEEDYQEMVNENIEKAKFLYNLSDEGIEIVSKLLAERKKIREENGLMAYLKINKINKEIQKKVKQYKRS